ncbi:hypothetical protein KQ876_00920 [Mycoplasma sp. CSL7491-lung]|nr:hypothetical protein [Mycoplasma sp. CSL7491-lung]MBU4692766.1 hypothetical protein [Mycoplasma sp. CSL7491-lung]
MKRTSIFKLFAIGTAALSLSTFLSIVISGIYISKSNNFKEKNILSSMNLNFLFANSKEKTFNSINNLDLVKENILLKK